MNKSQKPSAPVRRELTPEERESQILRFVQTKREAYATSILFGMVHNPNHGMTPEQCVDFAIKTADALFDKLFPGIVHAPENEQKSTK